MNLYLLSVLVEELEHDLDVPLLGGHVLLDVFGQVLVLVHDLGRPVEHAALDPADGAHVERRHGDDGEMGV